MYEIYRIHEEESPYRRRFRALKIYRNSNFHRNRNRSDTENGYERKAYIAHRKENKLRDSKPVLQRRRQMEELPRGTFPRRHDLPRQCRLAGFG